MEYEGGNIAEKNISTLVLGNSGQPRPVTVISNVNVLKFRAVTENHEWCIIHDIVNL